jgi:hypothetical protein
VKGLNAIDEIRNKFNLLLKKNKELSVSKKTLQDEIENLNNNNQLMANEINELKDKYKILKMSKKLDGDQTENSKEFKLKINEMVKEIDKCIALLNK